MTTSHKGPDLLLTVFPTRIGFGYSVHSSADTLLDWGIKWATEDKNKVCTRKFITLINYYKPASLVLEEIPSDVVEARPRVADLIRSLASIAATQNIRVYLYSRDQIREAFNPFGATTKHEIAGKTAEALPILSSLVPPKRKLWDPEPAAMSFFSAASLGLTHYLTSAQRSSHR
ncbi:hypothetical protein [Kordiimonas pumila]|uniref:Uncharacterized protein n=1 Tax=Kordiimonas pumila TaxID=2161677 RepID=A0ABV7D3K2_9PROT|nr:hypothetical protein [Kordiimonas pumila]